MWAAEDATKRVFGGRTVARDLKVKVLGDHERSDSDIATAVQSALRWDVFIPKAVTANVHAGAVTLEGQVSWNFERDAAQRAVRNLSGVVTVYNAITLKPHTSSAQVKEKIQSALQRQANSDANAIHIATSGSRVTLTGHVSSWQSMEDASNAAWAAPGVTEVVDQMKCKSRTDSNQVGPARAGPLGVGRQARRAGHALANAHTNGPSVASVARPSTIHKSDRGMARSRRCFRVAVRYCSRA